VQIFAALGLRVPSPDAAQKSLDFQAGGGSGTTIFAGTAKEKGKYEHYWRISIAWAQGSGVVTHLLWALPGGVATDSPSGPSGVLAFRQPAFSGEQARRFDFLMERFRNRSLWK